MFNGFFIKLSLTIMWFRKMLKEHSMSTVSMVCYELKPVVIANECLDLNQMDFFSSLGRYVTIKIVARLHTVETIQHAKW